MPDIDDVPSINLTNDDIDLIGRVVATEVPLSVYRENPNEYIKMVGAVADTILNRVAMGQRKKYGLTVRGVANYPRAFSKITGPTDLDPYGSVDNAPRASPFVQRVVNTHLANRSRGMASLIGGSRDYANPFVSSASNLVSWINPMIAAGALKLGIGRSVHYHGTAPGNKPTFNYKVTTPADLMPFVDPDAPQYFGMPVPTPTPRPPSPTETPMPERFGVVRGQTPSFPPMDAYVQRLRDLLASQPKTTPKEPRLRPASPDAGPGGSTFPQYAPVRPTPRPDPMGTRSIRHANGSDLYDTGRPGDETATASPFEAPGRAGVARLSGAPQGGGRANGGPLDTVALTRVIRQMQQAGASADEIRQMLAENHRRKAGARQEYR
jgi:hypothetical protein